MIGQHIQIPRLEKGWNGITPDTITDPGAWPCRQGIAGKLLQACEGLAAAAGFWTFFIQAEVEQQDRSGGIFMDTRRYDAAVDAFRKAGYTEYSGTESPSVFRYMSDIRALMFKVFAP